MITLATLPDAIEQEVFDQVKTHLLTQNVKSYGVGSKCAYRGANDTKCAAGCLIGDDEYRPIMDSQYGWWQSLIQVEMVPANHSTLIHALQRVHDQFEPDEWLCQLKLVAEEYKLEFKKENE
jgi:hypothetical protein